MDAHINQTNINQIKRSYFPRQNEITVCSKQTFWSFHYIVTRGGTATGGRDATQDGGAPRIERGRARMTPPLASQPPPRQDMHYYATISTTKHAPHRGLPLPA